MVKLRDYQLEAINIILKKKKVVLVMPTGVGKTYIALGLIKKLNLDKVIIVEPTRYLVEQTYNFSKKFNLNFDKIYGVENKKERIKKWINYKFAITTPETLYNDMEYIDKVNILILDECHHAIGNDPYAKILNIDSEYKLGLSAYIPKKYKAYFEKKIGEIIEYSYKRLEKYIPNWIGDIFESNFNAEEFRYYKYLENKYYNEYNKKARIYIYLAMKYFSVDGYLALKESYYKNENFKKYIDLWNINRELHKFNTLKQILKIYDFKKVLIFVDRRIVAFKLKQLLRDYKPTIIIGKSKNIKETLEEAKKSNIIISTSAGEEGIDLPTVDLLIIWSNTSNPLRFIQRQGRLLRKTNDKLKISAYIVTPYTIDVNLFIKSAILVRNYIDLRISNEVILKYFEKSPLKVIKDILEEPMYFEYIKQYLKYSDYEIRKYLKYLMKNGDIIYIYTPLGKLYILSEYIDRLYDKYQIYLNPKYIGLVKIKSNRTRKIIGDFNKLFNELKKRLPIDGITITKIKKNEVIEYIPRRYDFLIKNEKILETVIKNALS